MQRVKKHEILAIGISFRPCSKIHPAPPVIDTRESETLVSRQQTICEYRPAKPKRKTKTSQDIYAGKTTDGCESPVMDVMGGRKKLGWIK